MTQYSKEQLDEARGRAASAVSELDRQELAAKLCERKGLTYASLTEDTLGPMLVAYGHKLIGEVHTADQTVLRNWHARPYQADGTLGDGNGPYVSARAAAASLIPERAEEEPDTTRAG